MHVSEDRAIFSTRPAQFRLPAWAHEFLVRESTETDATKTDLVIEALEDLKRKRFEALMAEGYVEMAEEDLAEAKVWEPVLKDGLEDETW